MMMQDNGRSPVPGSGSKASPEAAEASSPSVTIPNARKRNWRGQFVKNLRMTPEGSREWLIWSRYHGLWHRRDRNSGGACGYTSDIAHAGLFPRSKAVEYNDGDRNDAFHVTEKMTQLTAALARHSEAVASLASAMSAGTAETEGLRATPASAVGESRDAQPIASSEPSHHITGEREDG